MRITGYNISRNMARYLGYNPNTTGEVTHNAPPADTTIWTDTDAWIDPDAWNE
jgi:hypothetical protein